MRTARDIRNCIVYAWEEGYKEGLMSTRNSREQEFLQLVAERLREKGLSEEEIQSILADKEESYDQTVEPGRQNILGLVAEWCRKKGFSEENFQGIIADK